jgi:hypothetical protein
MRRWSKFKCFTMEGNGLLEVSHGFGGAIAGHKKVSELVEDI